MWYQRRILTIFRVLISNAKQVAYWSLREQLRGSNFRGERVPDDEHTRSKNFSAYARIEDNCVTPGALTTNVAPLHRLPRKRGDISFPCATHARANPFIPKQKSQRRDRRKQTGREYRRKMNV